MCCTMRTGQPMPPPDLAHARSFLFTPGHQPERFGKALACGADAVILDLEDAVPVAEKAAARIAINTWLNRERPVLLRINAVHSACHDEDVVIARQPGVAGIVLAKAESAEQIASVSARCPGLPILPLLETARGVLNCMQIASAGSVLRLLWGAIDLCLDTGITAVAALDGVRLQLVIASRAAGIASPVDSVTPEFADIAHVSTAAAQARAFGFGAKLCIHPAQVPVVNAAFQPTPDELQWAKRVLQAADVTKGAATALDGVMLDAPLFAQAARIVAAAKALRTKAQ